MAKMTIISDYTAGDTLPVLKANWGLGYVDIAGWTITARLIRPDTTVFSKAAVITDAAAGDFEFRWLTSDLVAGFQPAVFKLVTSGGDILTIRSFAFDVATAV